MSRTQVCAETLLVLLLKFGAVVQSFVKISEIAWEEFEKVGLKHLANLQKKKKKKKFNSVNVWI